MSIRETTQAQAPRVLQKSRTALITVAGLSKNEAELGERTEHLLALVEETEYGIALPTTLRILSREMRQHRGMAQGGRRCRPHDRPGDASRGRPARAGPGDPPAPAHNSAAAGLPPLRGREGTRARAQPPDRRAQDGPDDPGTAQRRHGRGRQDPPRRVDLRLPPSGARSRRSRPRKTRFATRSRRSRSGCRSPKTTLSESTTLFSEPFDRGDQGRREWSVAAIRSVFSDPR